MSPQYGIDKPSLRNGYWFYFDDEGTSITAFGSTLSGREKVFVDDELISSKQNWRFSNCHKFTLNNADYEVEFRVTNWRTGELVCSLRKNGALLDTATKAYATERSEAFTWRRFVLGALYGGAIGFSAVWGFYTAKDFLGG